MSETGRIFWFRNALSSKQLSQGEVLSCQRRGGGTGGRERKGPDAACGVTMATQVLLELGGAYAKFRMLSSETFQG